MLIVSSFNVWSETVAERRVSLAFFIIASTYLRNGGEVGALPLLTCMGGVMLGSFFGSKAMAKIEEKKLRVIIGVAMIISIGALLFKMLFLFVKNQSQITSGPCNFPHETHLKIKK